MENKKHVGASDINAIPRFPRIMYFSLFIGKVKTLEQKTSCFTKIFSLQLSRFFLHLSN